MERNHEVTEPRQLLVNGQIAEPGWSRRLVQRYDRADVKAPAWRIKEWDYYLVLADDYAVALTVSDAGYVGAESITLLTFGEKPWEHTAVSAMPLPLGRLKLPNTSERGITHYEDKTMMMHFEVADGTRHITARVPHFWRGKPFTCDIVLDNPPMDTLVVATPWEQEHCFYYNQKINCMPASGWMELGEWRFEFDPAQHFGTLDWGRGVWTYDNTWRWGSGNARIDGHAFGFNVGYGFGNTAAATENILFWDGVGHKLDDVYFHIPDDDYLKPWRIMASDGRFEMDFVPVFDRSAEVDAKVLATIQHQVFGRLTGTAVLDDGTAIPVKDVMCFFEKVRMKY